MAIAVSVCLNLSSPRPASEATQAIVPQRDDKWRKQCVAGMACMVVIGVIQVCDGSAIAKDMGAPPLVVVAEPLAESKRKVPRWSDRRKCPPWHFNSLETIVPENLPRPSARRRWEAVGDYTNSAVKVSVKTRRSSSNCFSM